MASQAPSLMATNEMPGLADSAFCEPPTATSIPQASNANGTAPRLLTTSQTTRAPASAATLARSSIGWITPVDVSDCVNSTALTGCSARAFATSAGRIFSPHSYSTVWTVSPKASASLANRSAKNPASGTRTSSPGEKQLATADSSPPVPLEVMSTTSASVR